MKSKRKKRNLGSGGGQVNNFYIDGSQSPQATADAITRSLRMTLRTES